MPVSACLAGALMALCPPASAQWAVTADVTPMPLPQDSNGFYTLFGAPTNGSSVSGYSPSQNNYSGYPLPGQPPSFDPALQGSGYLVNIPGRSGSVKFAESGRLAGVWTWKDTTRKAPDHIDLLLKATISVSVPATLSPGLTATSSASASGFDLSQTVTSGTTSGSTSPGPKSILVLVRSQVSNGVAKVYLDGSTSSTFSSAGLTSAGSYRATGNANLDAKVKLDTREVTLSPIGHTPTYHRIASKNSAGGQNTCAPVPGHPEGVIQLAKPEINAADIYKPTMMPVDIGIPKWVASEHKVWHAPQYGK